MSGQLHARFNPLHAAPNLLTLMRICLAPFLVSAILENRLPTELWVVCGGRPRPMRSTARWRAGSSSAPSPSQYLDPVADKLLLSTLFLVLTHKKLIGVSVTALVFGRDVGILLVAAILYAAIGRREFKPSLFGKLNTVAQVTAVAAVLLHQIYDARWVIVLRTVALDATVVLTVASGLHYAWMVTRRMAPPVESGGPGK